MGGGLEAENKGRIHKLEVGREDMDMAYEQRARTEIRARQGTCCWMLEMRVEQDMSKESVSTAAASDETRDLRRTVLGAWSEADASKGDEGMTDRTETKSGRACAREQDNRKRLASKLLLGLQKGVSAYVDKEKKKEKSQALWPTNYGQTIGNETARARARNDFRHSAPGGIAAAQIVVETGATLFLQGASRM